MTSQEILNYYAETSDRKTREDLIFAASLVESDKVALDCGCGAGSDIAYLRAEGFFVYAFDIEEESIRLCAQRFGNDEHVVLAQDGFSSYDYPTTNLVNADASLFFCPSSDFDNIWRRIQDSLDLRGVFCGSFLGPEDTMAGPDYDSEAFWPDVLVFNESELRKKFQNFEILRFAEHKVSGEDPNGRPHNWHIFSVVARKI